jgi:hypothetical protein
MRGLRVMIGGLIGGLIGAAIWAGVTLATNYEVGWIAWGVGILTGLGVRLAAGDQNEGFVPGITAAVLALLSIVAGKYAAVHFQLERAVAEAQEKAGAPSDEGLISNIADEIVEEFQKAGKPLKWPPGVNPNDVHSEEREYPPDVWAEAQRRWQSQPEAERNAIRDQARAQGRAILEQLKAQIRDRAFRESFSAMDALFFLLAVLTAFKIGSGLARQS